MKKSDKMEIFHEIKTKLSPYSKYEIEDGVVSFFLKSIKKDYLPSVNKEIVSIIENSGMPADIETIVEFFESLIVQENKDKNGIVYTPKYISDFIVSSIFSQVDVWNEDITIIDPGCGGGIFLVSAIELIVKKYGIDVDTIISKNIFGIDLDDDNARRCSLVLRLVCAIYGGDYIHISPNIKCQDSLKSNWSQLFNIKKGFDYVIGNPPYVNPHDMNKKTVAFLKKTFSTTQKGVFNIFYAFIEQSMNYLEKEGKLGFIVPNNFLTIKSAKDLRDYLQKNAYLETIIDFGDNMVFKPVRTYNCIIFLSKKRSSEFNFFVLPTTNDIECNLYRKHTFINMPIDRLGSNGWKLVDKKTHTNLCKIERQLIPIKSFIRTGIATLRDGVFLINHDEQGFYKVIGDKKCYIENGLIKTIYKIPDLKQYENITDAVKYIIFPYIWTKNGYILIDEEQLKTRYSKTYQVLLANKEELDQRDKGKKNPYGWYAYGRTQGLNKYGKKLLFPTFANKPKFVYLDDEDALFCNGYAIFENDRIELDILIKILNSAVMNYYVTNTSYQIEGGFYCYQKKYIENFSIPWLTERNIEFIKSHNGDELDKYLLDLYDIEI